MLLVTGVLLLLAVVISAVVVASLVVALFVSVVVLAFLLLTSAVILVLSKLFIINRSVSSRERCREIRSQGNIGRKGRAWNKLRWGGRKMEGGSK